MCKLGLWFTNSGSGIELEKTSFQYRGMDREIVAVRGKTAGPNKGTGTFQCKRTRITIFKSAIVCSLMVASARTEGSYFDGSEQKGWQYGWGAGGLLEE